MAMRWSDGIREYNRVLLFSSYCLGRFAGEDDSEETCKTSKLETKKTVISDENIVLQLTMFCWIVLAQFRHDIGCNVIYNT